LKIKDLETLFSRTVAARRSQGSGAFARLSTRAGVTRAGGLAAALGLVGALFVGWKLLNPEEAGAGPVATPPTSAPATEPRLENPEATRVASGVGVEGPRPLPAYPRELQDPTRFAGLGRIEAHLVTKSGAALPTRWTLVLEPAAFRIGAEHARARRIEVENSTMLLASDIQLGSYTVRAEAGEWGCRPHDVELRKPDLIDHVFPLELYERGTLTGRVVDARGLPVEGLTVFALSRTGTEAREARTVADGSFAFERLPDGEWRVRVATRENPLASLEDVTFLAPSLHLRDFTVPPMGSLEVRVVDENGVGLVGALIEASGLASGPLTVTTGPDGLAQLGPGVKGDLLLQATDAQFGHAEARVEFDPQTPQGEPFVLKLRL
jgi:hypothetical protein